MIGEVIQEYLVALGAKIDKPGFREMDQTIQQSGELITRATGSWAANFVKASTIIASAIAGVKAATLGLMTAAAKQDLEMEKYARSMMISRDAAEQMKRATDALGESINDITLSPELSERFRELSADGGQMMVGGDFSETMRNFRDLIFQWTRLKQEASYAMTWIGYYLAKYLQKPLAEIRERFREFNDNFVKNISTWTEKAARAIVYILEIGRHFLQFLWDIGKALYNIWDSFPKGVKIATAALAGFWAVMRMSPLGRMITLVSALMLLIDDYYGYMEGKNAALGPLWDKLNEAIERGKELWNEIVPVLKRVYNSAIDVAKAFRKWLGKLRQDQDVKDFINSVKDLGKAVWDLAKGIWDFLGGAFSALINGFSETESAYLYRDALREILKFATELNKYLVFVTTNIKRVFSAMRESVIMKDFWKTQGQAAREFLDILVKAVGATGKLGQALLLLTRGKWEDAKRVGGEAWDMLRGYEVARDAQHGGLGGGFGENSSGFYGAAARYGSRLGGGIGGVDEFMGAIAGQESGFDWSAVNASGSGAAGAFQIMPESWASWSEDAGLGPNAPMTPENQALVARWKMLEYYKQFGNWRDVAIAWYGGPGAVNYSEEEKNRKQYWNGDEYPSINEYADSVMARMGGYSAEMSGGIGEGSTWIKQNDFVSYEGARPETMSAIDALSQWFYEKTGHPLVVTAVTNGDHAEGERSHSAGWKFDVNDWGSGAEGTLLGLEDGTKGSLTDAFIRYGQSLGLGMNWEGDHIDVSTLGDQWEGEYAGANFGGLADTINRMRSAFASNGFLPGGRMSTPPYMNNVGNTATVTVGDINVTIQGGANASAEELGRAFSDQVSAFFQPYGMALAGNNV